MSFATLPYPAHGWAYKQSCQQKSASDEQALLRRSNSSIPFVPSALIRPSSQGSLLQKKKKKLPSHKSWIIKSWMLEFSGWIGVSVSLLFDRQHERQLGSMTFRFWPPAVGCEPQPRLALRLEPDCAPRHFWIRRPAEDGRDRGVHAQAHKHQVGFGRGLQPAAQWGPGTQGNSCRFPALPFSWERGLQSRNKSRGTCCHLSTFLLKPPTTLPLDWLESLRFLNQGWRLALAALPNF